MTPDAGLVAGSGPLLLGQQEPAGSLLMSRQPTPAACCRIVLRPLLGTSGKASAAQCPRMSPRCPEAPSVPTVWCPPLLHPGLVTRSPHTEKVVCGGGYQSRTPDPCDGHTALRSERAEPNAQSDAQTRSASACGMRQPGRRPFPGWLSVPTSSSGGPVTLGGAGSGARGVLLHYFSQLHVTPR